MLACITILTGILFSQDVQTSNEIGFNLGWGNPFGASIEYSRSVTSNHSLGAAAGFSLAGARYGLDYKYLFNEDSKLNPYVGLAGSYATGISKVNVNVNRDSAKYELKGGTQIAPRAGLRYRAGFASLYLNTGYGIPVSGGGVRYLSGSSNSRIKSFAEIFALGGSEISGSMMFRF